MTDSNEIYRIVTELDGCVEKLGAAIDALGDSPAAVRVVAAREALAVVLGRARELLVEDAAEVADRVGGQPPIHRDGMVCVQY